MRLNQRDRKNKEHKKFVRTQGKFQLLWRMAACGAAVMIGVGAGVPVGTTGEAYAAVASTENGQISDQETSVTGTQDTVAQAPTFDPARFVLPETAKVLVVTEGTGGSACKVYAYEKVDGAWNLKVTSDGYLGANGMSNHRHSGDKTTPIGVFCMNTPFGLKDAQTGFPSNYVKVDSSYVWSDISNTLEKDPSGKRAGERVGEDKYKGYYDYAIDAGYNTQGILGQGSALFLHCAVSWETSSSGCVAIEEEKMAEILKLYGAYGDGACYMALAPAGTFDQIYSTYGANMGLSPKGTFEGTAR